MRRMAERGVPFEAVQHAVASTAAVWSPAWAGRVWCSAQGVRVLLDRGVVVTVVAVGRVC